jgi:predicted RNase H-like nuclease (RuvC/YqgF family)
LDQNSTLLAEKEKKILQVEATVKANEHKISDLEKNLTAIKSWSLEVTEQKDKEATSSSKKLQKVAAETIDLGEYRQMETYYKGEVDSLSKVITALDNDREGLQKKLDQYQQKMRNIEQRVDVMAELEVRVENLLKENTQWRSELEESSKRVKS